MHRILSLLLFFCSTFGAYAQEWMKMHVENEMFEGQWTFPYRTSHFSHYDFSDNDAVLRMHRIDETDANITYIPFAVDMVDSITFVDDPENLSKDKYRVFTINITIENFDTLVCYYNNPAFPGENGARQDWYNCYVSVDGHGAYPDYAGTARVRGRGNSSWRWYPKKPMKLKLDEKSKLLGMGSNKDWVLLANYRDVTDLMQAFGMVAGKKMGIPYASGVRFAEVFLNGEYQGLYQVAEQVEQGSHRVDVADNGGVLLTIDTDDGDDTWKYNTDSMCFWSKVYNLPIGIKYPKALNQDGRNRIRDEFAILENTLKNGTYDDLDTILDIPTYIALMQLNDLVYNNDFPNRSVFLSRTPGGKWRFGPPWDYDAGFRFTGNQYTSHSFFRNGFTGMKITPSSTRYYYNSPFRSGKFTRKYVEQWNSYADSIMSVCWPELMKYVAGMNELNDGLSPRSRDIQRWPMLNDYGTPYSPDEETERMEAWLRNRIEYMTGEINNFKIPSFDDDETEADPDTTSIEPLPDDYTDYYGNPSGLNLDQMTRVGGETVTVEYDLSMVRSMSKQRIALDIERILASFAQVDYIDASDLIYMGFDNLATHDLTSKRSSSDGFYMNWVGQVCVWQAEIMQCKIGWNASGGNLTFAYTGSATTTDRCTASVFLVYDNYYYELKMQISFSNSWGGWTW